MGDEPRGFKSHSLRVGGRVAWALTLAAGAALVVAAVANWSTDRDDAVPRPGPALPAVADGSPPRALVDIGSAVTPTTNTTILAAVFEFVDFRTFGGPDRRDERLRVFPDGRMIYDDGARTVTLSVTRPAVVDELRSALQAAGVASLPPVSGSADSGDLQQLVLFDGRSVRFVTGSAPPPLAAALVILEAERARGRQALA